MQVSTQNLHWNSMYPSAGFMFENGVSELPEFCKYCSVYGYSYGNNTLTIDGKEHRLEAGQYFGLSVLDKCTINATSKLFLAVRLGFLVPNTLGWVEKQGRLSYIDGCSDSLLVYPSRLGDGSMSLLYFPPGINQTFHRHPSLRLGCVISGSGFSQHGETGVETEDRLETGLTFSLSEHERHRFRTAEESMTVIAFHPDGDWGPTDHNHTMLNRTYIDQK